MSDLDLTVRRTRIHPLRAVRALYRTLRCKEATYEVFRLVAALDGPQTERNFQFFARSEPGQRFLREKRDLGAFLSDHARLAAMPAGSFGRAYLDFITSEGLSAEGFQNEMDRSGEKLDRLDEHRQRFIYRFRHTHDLFHVLTGYGRDFIGELSLLAFTRHINRSRAFVPLIFFGLFKAWREYPGLPVRACIAEGAGLGRKAADLLTPDWEGLLALPLPEVRRRLGIGMPKRYLAIQHGAEAVDRRYREAMSLPS